MANRIVHSGTKLIAVPGTPRPLGPDTACEFVDVVALQGNTDDVVIGPEPGVILSPTGDVQSGPVALLSARKGFALQPGRHKRFPAGTLSQLWLDAVVADEGVLFEAWG